MNRRTLFSGLVLALILGAAFLASPTRTLAGESPDPVGIPGKANAFGHTYGEWSAAWWKWAYELPDENHPLSTTGDVDCSYAQSERAWFLVGTTGGEAERSCTLPVGQPLFYPIVNFTFINAGPDYDYCGEDGWCTVEEKREVLTWYFDTFACGFYSTVDGVPTVQIRTQSPPFPVVANNNIFVPEGIADDEVVSEGAWVLLPPLSRGEHTLQFGGGLCDPDTGAPLWTVAATYHLTVVPKSQWER